MAEIKFPGMFQKGAFSNDNARVTPPPIPPENFPYSVDSIGAQEQERGISSMHWGASLIMQGFCGLWVYGETYM